MSANLQPMQTGPDAGSGYPQQQPMQQPMQQMPHMKQMTMQQMQAMQPTGHMGPYGGGGMPYGYPTHPNDASGGPQQQQQQQQQQQPHQPPGGSGMNSSGYVPMQGPPMGPPGGQEGGGASMVGMAPYPMDGHGGPHQAMMMMMQPGVPGGYVMVQPNMQGMMMRGGVGQTQDQTGGQTGHGHPGMQEMQGLPPNMQLMMVQPGMGNMPNMQVAMQAPPSHGGHGSNEGANAAALMMMSNPAGMSAVAGGGMAQGGGMNQGSMVDVDGKGSRVAALSRSSQPKQGVGSWHTGDRRGARPPAPGSAGMDHSAGGVNMPAMPFSGQGHGPPQVPQGGAGMQAAQASGGDADGPEQTPTNKRMSNPAKPWADIQDDRHGGLDRETQELWQVKHGQSASRMGDTPPQRNQGQQMPKQMQSGVGNTASATSGRSKAGRNEGGKGGSGDKKGSSRASPQETTPVQKWVEVRNPMDSTPPASGGGAGKGQGKGQASAPKQEMAPKAAAPMPHMPPVQPLIPPPSTKGGGGGKKKSRGDRKLDDWLSQRWAGRSSPGGGMEGDAAAAATTNDTWSSNQAADNHAVDSNVSASGYDDSKDASYHEEYGEEESDGRRGKKKGGKGGKGKSDDRRREKGKGKGKSSRGWWRAQN